MVATLLLTGLLLLEHTWGWGPYTHAGFGSLFYASYAANHACNGSLRGDSTRRSQSHHEQPTAAASSVLEGVFVTSNFFPDAFKLDRSWMHSFEFAAFQLERAAALDTNATSTSPADYHHSKSWSTGLEFIRTDSIKAFSYGYMMHLVEDFVGHHEGGYLNPKHDHPLEFHVDTLFYEDHSHDPSPWQYRNKGMEIIEENQHVKQQLVKFVSETSQQYAKQFPNMEGLSMKEVDRCIQRFSSALHMETFAMVANSKTYKGGITRYDVCHAKTFLAANATLTRAIRWVEEAMGVFEHNLFPFHGFAATNKILVATNAIRRWVEATFAQHNGTICKGRTALRPHPKIDSSTVF
ncbi:expressed unknown protein [Seminavis robusta]|uniref:Phospholipase C/D domain-containing protein n=1 Tax=Seminavis robusta TaxID=568900 RepID=A0A9N8DFJ5_9STRA|nr:expressed unknown protein [Seminavis robusta]|eukprot:Sro94_g049070.1 n/a (351) ;mRNA; r:89012-90064